MKLILVVCCLALASAQQTGNGTCSTGMQGPTGVQGPAGMQGIQGPQGAPGVQGTEGPQGVPGCEGKRGPLGSGPKGDQGDQGDQGVEGPMGMKGDDGEAGKDGKQGPRGGQGPQGPIGLQGNPGQECNATLISSMMREIKLMKEELAKPKPDYSPQFTSGDGTGTGNSEIQIGTYNTDKECYQACVLKKSQNPDINGVTYGDQYGPPSICPIGSSNCCYCEIKMSKIKYHASGWRTAYIQVDGVWSSWSSWDQCTQTCGGGTQKATRTCSGTAYGGKQCAGASVKSQGCNKQKCAPKYNTEFKGSKRKVNSAGVAYAGVFYVDGRAVCDDGLWDDGKKANDIKKQADVACRMAGFPKGWKVQSGEIDDQSFTGDTIYVGLNCKGTEQSLDECTYKQPKKQSRSACAVGVYLECQY